MPAFWDTHRHPMITLTNDSHQIPCHKKTKSKLQIPKICQIFKFCNNPYTRHTICSCLIRCANMKWIRLVLWKIQSKHGFVHRRMDRRTDGWTTWNKYTPLLTPSKGGGIINHNQSIKKQQENEVPHWWQYLEASDQIKSTMKENVTNSLF